jgi:hypothetical protein
MLPVIVLLGLAHISGAAEVCCPTNNLGCFSNDPPFNLLPLPTCATTANTGFLMFTRTNRDVGQPLTDTLIPPGYVASRRTVFMAHAWTSSGSQSHLHSTKNAYLEREDINVVIVDWATLAATLNYLQGASNTRTVGALIAQVMRNLLTVSGTVSGRLWCVGHSLGSHVCGHAGMKMPADTPLGRITGLDPAGPSFQTSSDKTIGLNPTSATFVDVLHTDSLELGTLRDVGHIDFYPNGGIYMPGCALQGRLTGEALENWDSDESIQAFNLCAHVRAFEFLEESIYSDCFQARQRCSNYNDIPGSCVECTVGAFPCAYMGYAADMSPNPSGLYYLTITADPPYCTS